MEDESDDAAGDGRDGKGGPGRAAGGPDGGVPDDDAPNPSDGARRAWIPVTGPEAARGELEEAYRRAGVRGKASNVVGVHSLHPAALEAHLELYRTVVLGPSPLSRRLREALAVVVSAANDCFY